MHDAFRVPVMGGDEVLHAPLGRRDGQDGEVREVVGLGMQTSLPGIGV